MIVCVVLNHGNFGWVQRLLQIGYKRPSRAKGTKMPSRFYIKFRKLQSSHSATLAVTSMSIIATMNAFSARWMYSSDRDRSWQRGKDYSLLAANPVHGFPPRPVLPATVDGNREASISSRSSVVTPEPTTSTATSKSSLMWCSVLASDSTPGKI
jgi:hypothetical protein